MSKNKQVFQIPAVLDGFTPLKDGGVSLRFHTAETTKSDKMTLMDFYDTDGYLMFAKNEFEEPDVPKDNAKVQDGKSPSQRLRAVIFIEWREGKTGGDFESYYRRRMEQLIEYIKRGLPS